MKIFITGSTGFIGTHLVRRLVQKEHELVCLVRPTSKVDELEGLGVTLMLGDVTDKQSLLEGMRGCGWVLNLANVYTLWEKNRDIYRKVNVEGTRNVMECALENRVEKIVHVSTVGVWGKPAKWPITEGMEVGSERFSEYAKTKYEGDLIAWDLMRTRGLPLVMIYPAIVCGPGNTRYGGRYVQDLIHKRLPAQAFVGSIKTFVHVKDVAEAIVRVAQKKDNIGEKYIVGKHMISINEFNKIISEISGTELPGLSLPLWLARLNASILTPLADLTGRQPLWGLSRDTVSTMAEDCKADGSKVEKELGITYMSIRQALEDEIHPPKEIQYSYMHRRYSRFRVSKKIMIQPEDMEQKVVLLKDISRGGLYAETDKPLREGMNVSTGFSEGIERFPMVRGKVLRKTDKGMAVKFVAGGADNIPDLISH